MEILIIQTAFPGDLFLSLPLLKQTRQFFPKARIHLMCRQGMGQIFLDHGLVDELFEVKKGESSSYQQAFRSLRSKKIALVISPHRSIRTAFFIKKLKPEKSIGYKLWWNSFFFTSRVSYSKFLPDSLRQLELLTLASSDFKKIWSDFDFSRDLKGNKDQPLVDLQGFSIPEWMSSNLNHNYKTEDVICVAPGSVWPTKRWPSESYSELVRKLILTGYQVKIIGTNADRHECLEVYQKNPKAENLCGQTQLPELYDLFCRSKLLVCNDSGAMHVAAAADLPTLALFGPTVPEFGFRPWQQKARLLQVPLGCRPCSPHGTKECPIGTHECLTQLSVDAVFEQVREMLNLPNSPSH